MKTAAVSLYLDTSRTKKNGLHSVKIRITHNKKRKYFATGYDMDSQDFEQVLFGKRKTEQQRQMKVRLEFFEKKALEIIERLPAFSFNAFTEKFVGKRQAHGSVAAGFDEYIENLFLEKRIGTASSYRTACNSLESFKADLTFADITPTFLKRYENHMVSNGASSTTIGIYLRSLRAVYNYQDIDPSVYPFGKGKKKYQIPIGSNVKKALTMEEITAIYRHEVKPNTVKEMARDYWIFLYLCNGLNVKDMCLLKWENIDNDMLTYVRAKTKRSRKASKRILVALKPESKLIIKKWGERSLDKNGFIFPHLEHRMDAVRQRKVYQQLTKIINKYMKQIAKELGIEKNVTTYYARHSFATVMKRSGAGIELISDLLGHSNVSVTESYLDSFENDQIQKQTDALTLGFKKAL